MADLSQARVRALFNYDPETGILTWRSRPVSDFKNTRIQKRTNTRLSGKEAGTFSSTTGYIYVGVDQKLYAAHRIIWIYVNGSIDKEKIDHINGDRTDNRIVNLRCVTNSENRLNACMRSDNRSGHNGVSWDKTNQKWLAHITFGGKTKNLGRFEHLQCAVTRRRIAQTSLGFHENHGRQP